MRSRTSAFNRTLFTKTLRRFWPLWAMYFAAWFLALPASVNSELRWRVNELRLQLTVLNTAQYGGVVIGMIAAVAVVMAVWSFMYSSRSVSGMACLPVSRGGVFLSVSLAGFLPLLCINVIIALLTLGVEAIYGVAAPCDILRWFGICSMELVLFFGFALLCAQLTGNLVVLPAVYAVLNFTVFAVEELVRETLRVFVYGMSSSGGLSLDFLSPPVWLLSHVTCQSFYEINQATGNYSVAGYTIGGWGALCAYAVAGIVMALAALALYRRRRMETAGDVVAISWLCPIFKYCMTFGSALVIGWVLYSFSGATGAGMGSMTALLALMLFGAFVGYFAAEMLIKKSFRVFRGGWAGFGISAAVIVLLMCAAELDLFGYERYVPQADSIVSVDISAQGETAELELPENIALALELHHSIIDGKHANESVDTGNMNAYSTYVSLCYELENGRVIDRSYTINWNMETGENNTDVLAAQELLNVVEALKSRKETSFEYTPESILSAYIDLKLTPEEAELLKAEGRVMDVSYYSIDGGYIENVTADKPVTDAAYTECTVQLSVEEAYELYSECILPDIADGTLGKIWLITDESYLRTVSTARINIDARIKNTNGQDGNYDSYIYDYFYTNVTKDSARTAAWLESHGIPLHMRSEFEVE